MPTPSKSAMTANQILNQVAAEVGVQPAADPFSSIDPQFVQMRYLLNAAGDELVTLHPWEVLQSEAFVDVPDVDPPGEYALPDDFAYMINQTGWERNENVPLFGPLSAQDWQYLLGRDLVTSTIYASFRLNEGVLKLFPPDHPGLQVYYEYVSNRWVRSADDPSVFTDQVLAGGDTPVYHRNLISRYLKVKYYEARGLDTSAAQASFNQQFLFMTGQNEGGEVLNAGRVRRGFPYLDSFYNTPDSGYGM